MRFIPVESDISCFRCFSNISNQVISLKFPVWFSTIFSFQFLAINIVNIVDKKYHISVFVPRTSIDDISLTYIYLRLSSPPNQFCATLMKDF